MRNLSCWQLGTLRVCLEANPRDHQWLEEMWCAAQAPRVANEGPFDFEICLRHDDQAYSALCEAPKHARLHENVFIGQHSSEPVLGWPGDSGYHLHDPSLSATLVLKGQGRVEITGATELLGGRILWLRVIRDLWVRSWAKGPMLHAACAAHAGRGLAIVGRKGAGKTSLLTYLMQSVGLDFVTNDRLLLDLDGAHKTALGVATIVAHKAGTEAHFPKLRPHAKVPRYLHRRSMSELEGRCWADAANNHTGPLNLSRAQFTQRLGCRATGACVPAVWLFPELDNRLTGHALERLAPEDADERLRKELFPSPSDTASEIWTDLLEIPPQRARPIDLLPLPALRLRIGTQAWKTPNLANAVMTVLETTQC